MVPLDDCIFGNNVLHARFCATTEILARLVSTAPRAVSLPQLEQATNRTPKDLAKLCAALARAGLLRAVPGAVQSWSLTCEPSHVTLEDVFRCVLNERPGRSSSMREATQDTAVPERLTTDVNLLVTQAMIAVNQSVFKHLRQFSLDRLKISAAVPFPVARRPLRAASLDDVYDLATSGCDASYDSPMRVPA